ncbi:MAG: hypothetical protein HC861_08735, partial [Rhodospirillaceae bacterium]|nr:hypothetical protein [Rhodospirillaceae bacterium]
MLSAADTYAALASDFRWQVPQRYNIGVDVCDRWAAREPERVALTFVGADNQARDYSYRVLRAGRRRSQKARPAAWLFSDGEKNRKRKSSSTGTGLPATCMMRGFAFGLDSPLRGPVPT